MTTEEAIRARQQARRERALARIEASKVPASVEEESKEEPAVEVEEPSYRDLQAQAKDLDIPANQSADDLKAAIEAAEPEEASE